MDALSREGTVLANVRESIVEGAWAPGQRLAPVALAERFGTSTTVVREALTRLVGESLIVAKQNRGFFIPELDVRELQDTTELRCVTEALALKLAIERGDLDWETALIAAHHRLAKTPRRLPQQLERINEDWTQAHRAFHHALLAGCGCESMMRVAGTLALGTELYRRWAAPLPQALQRDVEAEHRAIVEAALQRDVSRAVELVVAHYKETSRVVAVAGLSKARGV